MGLIHDQQIPPLLQELAGMILMAGPVIGGDGTGAAVPVGRFLNRSEFLQKLVGKFFNPLGDQGGRRENQYSFGQAANGELFQDDSGFDGLAEANFVGQDGAAVHGRLKHLLRDHDLVGQFFDSVHVEGNEPVEGR